MRRPAPSPPADPDALRRENERLRRAVEELSVLNELAAELGGARELEAVMQTVVRRSLRAVSAEQGVVTLLEEEMADGGRTLVREAVTSAGRSVLRLEQGLLGWMLHHRRPLRLDDPAANPLFRPAADSPALRSLLAVPLLVRSRLVGVLTAFNKTPAEDEFTPEDERLLSIIAAQSAQVIENARLREDERALLLVQEQLRLAAEIQTRLLPAAPPEVPGYDVAGWTLSSEAVGGDYFDFIPMTDERLGLAVGDVVGKGLTAALLMANLQATLRGQAAWTDSAAACLTHANALLHASTSRREFVTLFLGVLDPAAHRLRYANAGHNRPLLLRPGAAPEVLPTAGLALGLSRSATYGEAEVSLGPGDLVVAFSDGVTEAMGPERELFSDERLEAVLSGCAGESATGVIERIAEAVRRHAADTPQSDDVTVLALRRLR